MWIKKNSDGTFDAFNFLPPEGVTGEVHEVLFPFYEKQATAYAATIAATVSQFDTFIQPAQLTGALTLNLTISAQVTPGAKLHLKLAADGSARTVTLGTGFNQGLASVVVAASKVAFLTFTYDGTSFVPAYSVPA